MKISNCGRKESIIAKKIVKFHLFCFSGCDEFVTETPFFIFKLF